MAQTISSEGEFSSVEKVRSVLSRFLVSHDPIFSQRL